MDIKCKKLDCKYNKSCCCTASKVKVGYMVDCETYEFNEQKAQDLKQETISNMFEVSGPLTPHIANKEVKISCDAICLFNKEGKCCANGITVLENKKQEPECVTQIK